MSDYNLPDSTLPEYNSGAPFGTPSQPRERVGLGLLAALGAVLVGVVLTVVVWRMGFLASITSLVIALGAAMVYTKVAGAAPRRGLLPLIGIILVGVVASFFAVVASDAWTFFDQENLGAGGESRVRFITDMMFNADILKGYGKDMAMFFVFAALGIFSTLRRLLSSH
jgi:hypothetical protein